MLKSKKVFSHQSITKRFQIKFSSHFDNIILISREVGWLSFFQLDSMRKLIGKKNKKNTRFWFPKLRTFSVTKKPNEVRMGKGKGGIKASLMSVCNGDIITETSCKKTNVFHHVQHKLPLKTKTTECWL